MEYLVKLVEALAWPAAAISLSIILRSEIRKLLGRVSSLKYKDLEANFEKGLITAEEKAKKAHPEKEKFISGDEEPVYPPPHDSRYEQLLRIAEESPRAALLEAWVEVETSLSEAAERFNINNSRRVPSIKVVIGLIDTGKYAKTIFPLFEGLRVLRNEAAHAPQFVPTERQTKRYLQMAIEMALTFQNPLDSN